LRQVKPERFERVGVENAAALVRTLMERFAVKPRTRKRALFRMSGCTGITAGQFDWNSRVFRRAAARLGQDKKL
jgi:hypothetical protein